MATLDASDGELSWTEVTNWFKSLGANEEQLAVHGMALEELWGALNAALNAADVTVDDVLFYMHLFGIDTTSLTMSDVETALASLDFTQALDLGALEGFLA
jgi:hypothetical protein